MTAALTLAARGLGRVWPNPAVACLIVKNEHLISRAITAPGGRPHAETQALALAGAKAKGATAYVTLEPCAHHGQTPPCATALIEAGISRIVVALRDPDKRVAGKGLAILREAGCDVVTGVMETQAARLNAGFLKHRTQGLPLVTLKLASTLDGRIATQSGDSQWITGPIARRRVHLMRSQHDAIMVGRGTALADDPALTVRGMGDLENPLRVVLDNQLRLPISAQLADPKQAQTWVVAGRDADHKKARALEAQGLRVFPSTTSQVDAEATLRTLASEGITRVFCEGGGALAASLIKAGLVDRIAWFTGGALIGSEGLPALGALGLDRLADAPKFSLYKNEILGPDTLSLWDATA